MILSDGVNGFQLATRAHHGTMAVTNNGINFAVTAVADTTFNTPSQFTLLTGAGMPWASESLNGITFDTDKLTVSQTGIYRIDLWGNIAAFPGPNARIAFRYRVNGTTYSLRKPTIKTDGSANAHQITGFGLISLTAGDYIQLTVASDVTGNLQFSDANTTLELIRAT